MTGHRIKKPPAALRLEDGLTKELVELLYKANLAWCGHGDLEAIKILMDDGLSPDEAQTAIAQAKRFWYGRGQTALDVELRRAESLARWEHKHALYMKEGKTRSAERVQEKMDAIQGVVDTDNADGQPRRFRRTGRVIDIDALNARLGGLTEGDDDDGDDEDEDAVGDGGTKNRNGTPAPRPDENDDEDDDGPMGDSNGAGAGDE